MRCDSLHWPLATGPTAVAPTASSGPVSPGTRSSSRDVPCRWGISGCRVCYTSTHFRCRSLMSLTLIRDPVASVSEGAPEVEGRHFDSCPESYEASTCTQTSIRLGRGSSVYTALPYIYYGALSHTFCPLTLQGRYQLSVHDSATLVVYVVNRGWNLHGLSRCVHEVRSRYHY